MRSENDNGEGLDNAADAGTVVWLDDRRAAPPERPRTDRYLPQRLLGPDPVAPQSPGGLRFLEPVLAYDPVADMPAAWSDETPWFEVAQTVDAFPSLDLPQGWAHQWTFASKFGKKVETETVAQVSPTTILDADPIRRPLWYRGKTSRAGISYVSSTGRHHAHDSMFERDTLTLLGWAGAEAILSQPGTLTYDVDGRTRTHTPDFAARVGGVFTIINCRPRPRLDSDLLDHSAAFTEVCLSRGWRYVLVTGYTLPAKTSIETVGAKAGSHDWLGYSHSLLELLASPTPWGEEWTFEEACAGFDYPGEARNQLQRLIWERQVGIDLNRLLTDDSALRLAGGRS